MGSTFKIFSVAQGIEKDLFTLDSLIDTKAFRINSEKLKISINSITKVLFTR